MHLKVIMAAVWPNCKRKMFFDAKNEKIPYPSAVVGSFHTNPTRKRGRTASLLALRVNMVRRLKYPVGPEIVLEFREVGGVEDAVQVGVHDDVVSRRWGNIRLRAKGVFEQIEVGAIHNDFRSAIANRARHRVTGRISTA